MSTKTISIMDDVYEGLIRSKKGEESFSEEIRRLLKERKPKLLDCIGLWNYMGKEEIDDIESAIKERRAYTAKIREKKLKELKE